MVQPTVPGWYGKLPSLGDFASRRLDPDLVTFWDDWLCEALQGLRTAQGGQWLDTYLSAPRWQFALLPGALPGHFGPGGWAGVLMPSVDRVGRYFPFLLLQHVPDLAAATAKAPGLWHWLDGLDELAASALELDWTVEQLERALRGCSFPGEVALEQPRDGQVPEQLSSPWPDHDPVPVVGTQQPGTPHASGCTYWLSRSHSQHPVVRAFAGLPPRPADMLGLLNID
jgi:type VI secretion system protein ImpM